MNPYPFSLLNHFTVPSAICMPPRHSLVRKEVSRRLLLHTHASWGSHPDNGREASEEPGVTLLNRVQRPMRLATYRVGDQDRAAVETESGPVDAGSLLGSGPVGLKGLLTAR